MSAVCTVRQTTDGFDLDGAGGRPSVLRVGYDESSIDILDIPRFDFTVPNQSGVEAHRLFIGKEVAIRRHGVLAMPGIVEDAVPTQGGGRLTSHLVKGLHTGYALLQARKLTNYDFDEDGLAATTRDGVTINPHNRLIFRSPTGALGVDGLPPGVDGVTFDTAARCCIGTRMVHQIDFQDNRYLIPSQVYATSNAIQAYRDGPQSQVRPALQRVRNGANFKAGVEIHSVPLYGNDKNINVGGAISTVAILLLGKRDSGSNNVTLSACRNASAVPASRTYTSIPLTFTSNYNGSGLDAWSGSADLSSDGASVTNVLGFKLNIAGGTGTTDTTYIYYGKLTATTVSDSGISEGTIAAYDNPFTLSGSENWVETDLQGETALSALGRLQGLTASDPAVNPNPHWDMWIDSSLAFHFAERRGSAIAKTYSFDEGNLKVIEHEYLGGELAYQTVGYGPGSGDAQTRIASKQAFSSGGFYDADRDWTVNPSTALYGRRARIIDFVDANERSVVNLYRKTYAHHKLHRDPIEAIHAELQADAIAYFTVGDSVSISNLPTRTNATPRAIKMRRDFSGDSREKLSVTFGQPTAALTDRLQSNSQQSDALTYRFVPTEAQLGISGNGLYFDKDHYGVYSIPIEDGSQVKGVKLRVGVLPWQATAKTAAAGGGSAATTDAGGASVPTTSSGGSSTPTSSAGAISVLKKAQAVARAGSVNSTDYGVQALSPGNVDNKNLTGATAVAPTISGSTANNAIVAGISQAGATVTNESVVSAGETILNPTMTTATIVDYEGFVVEFSVEGGDNVDWHFVVKLNTNLGLFTVLADFIPSFDDTFSILRKIYIPSAWLRQYSFSTLTGIEVFAQPTSGSTQVLNSATIDLISVPLHTHPSTGLTNSGANSVSGSIVGGLIGNSGSKTLSPGTLLTAADLNALLGAVQVGYASSGGGTGTIIYTQDAIDYYDQHQHTVSVPAHTHTVTIPNHTHDVTIPAHTHPLSFGIFQYGGDSDSTGNLAPLYGTGITLAADPTIAAASGIPSGAEFSAAQHPLTIGHSQTIPGTYEFDITGYLSTDANGIIKSGEHRVFFKGAAGADNANGLAVLSITPIYETAQNKRA